MPNESIQAVDRLAHVIIKNLHKLFGFSYSRNTEHFTYQIDLDTGIDFVVGTQITGSLRISQEADFICTKVNCESRWVISGGTAGAVGKLYCNTLLGDPIAVDDGNNLQDVPFNIEITDGSTDRVLQNQPVSARAVYGMAGGLPGIWSKARMFARNSNVTVRVTMLRLAIGGNNDGLRNSIVFMGYKIYDASSLDLTTRRP